MRKKKNSKHLSYYDLIEVFEKPGCPICRLTKKGIEDYYESLIYEYINDMGFRDTFRIDKGFCKYHAYKFLEYNDGLAVSLPYRDLLNDILKDLKSVSKRNKKEKKASPSSCMVCRMKKDIEKTYLSIIVDYIEDDEFVSKFVKSDGLCIPHYERLLSRMKHPPKWLVDFHVKKYREILKGLDRYIDSCNYSLGERRPKLTKKEKLVWKKVVEYIYGQK